MTESKLEIYLDISRTAAAKELALHRSRMEEMGAKNLIAFIYEN